MSGIIDNYHNGQQDLLETFVDRGQLRKLAEPTTLANGKRIPGLKLDHPRQLAVMHALVRFANIAAGSTFTTPELYVPALDDLGSTASRYSLASFRYDLSKRRAKGLVGKIPHSRRYRLVGTHRRSSKTIRRRSQTRPRQALRTRPTLSMHRRRPAGSSTRCRIENRRLMKRNENKILVACRITD
jgi:hypothetical protein